MSLVTPLVKPLSDSLVKPLVNNDAAIFAARSVLGEKWPLTNTLAGSQGTPITLTRASAAIYENVYGKYQKFATNIPAFSGGWLDVSGQIQNKCTNYNLNPTDLADVTLTDFGSGAVLSVVDDSENLRALGFGDLIDSGVINGNVYKLVTGDAGANVSIAGQVGNTNEHTISVFARVEGGLNGNLLLSSQGGSAVSFANSEYQKITNTDTPAASTRVAVVQAVGAGATLHFFANHLTETTTAPKQLIECAGAAGTQALDNASVSTTGWPVNDCALAGAFIYRGSASAFPAFFSSEVDVNNRTRLAFNPASPNMTFQKRVAGTNYTATVPLSTLSVNDYFEWLAVQDAVNGMTFYVRQNGVLLTAGTNANTLGLQLGSTGQIGNVAALANETNGSYAPLARFDSSNVTLEGVFDAC